MSSSTYSSKTNLLPSVYQIFSGLVRGSSDSPFWGFVQWSKVYRQDWKGREPSGVGRKVAGLRTSQGETVRPGFSIITSWYLMILWSDIHKWLLPLRSCFTWWLVKIVGPQKRVLKHILNQDCNSCKVSKSGGDFFPIREEGNQGPLETGGKKFVHSSNKVLKWIFL